MKTNKQIKNNILKLAAMQLFAVAAGSGAAVMVVRLGIFGW